MQNKISIGNDAVSYEEFGSGKEVVILLPSLWVTSKSYRTLGKELSSKYRVLIPDLYKGKSSFSKSARSLSDYAQALNLFTETLGLSGFYLLGISFSGLVSVKYSQLYPQRVKRLFLASTLTVPIEIKNRKLILFWGYLKLLFRNCFSLSGIRANVLWFVDGLTYFLRHPKQFFLESLVATNGYDNKFSEMTVPTKLVFALKDEFINVAYLENMKSIGNVEIETVDGYHAWFFYKEKVFADKVLGFLRSSL